MQEKGVIMVHSSLFLSFKMKLLISDIHTLAKYQLSYYRFGNQTWQNSIKSQLTTNDCFYNAEKAAQGEFWKLSNNLTGVVSTYLKSNQYTTI